MQFLREALANNNENIDNVNSTNFSLICTEFYIRRLISLLVIDYTIIQYHLPFVHIH